MYIYVYMIIYIYIHYTLVNLELDPENHPICSGDESSRHYLAGSKCSYLLEANDDSMAVFMMSRIKSSDVAAQFAVSICF